MNQRPLGRTGLEVSEVGFGAWQLGNEKDWGPMTDAEAINLVQAAVDLGVTFFDTAPNYALGRSEELLGRALQDRRNRVVLCSKFGTHPDGRRDFNPALLRPSIENTLRTLRTDVVDVVVLHNPPEEAYGGEHPLQEGLRQLRDEGLVRAWGVSVDTGADMEPILAHSDAQVIEINFNLLHQEPRAAMVKAMEQGVGLVVKGPLDSGWLAGKYSARSVFTDVRARWSREIIVRRASLVDQIRQHLPTGPLAPQAVGFVLGHPEVSTVIPGVRNRDQLTSNALASEVRLEPSAQVALQRWWDETFRGEALLPW